MEIIEYKGALDGTPYSCLYSRVYKEDSGLYELALLNGSIRWGDPAGGIRVEAQPTVEG